MDERIRTSNQTSVGELIDKLIKAYRWDGKLKELDLLDSWSEMMGVAVANRTKQLFIKNRVLHVHLDSAVMRDELAHGKQIIIERVNQKAGTKLIDDVWFA
jgi:predicted nucleic acid-binding Zn ribbon protein